MCSCQLSCIFGGFYRHECATKATYSVDIRRVDDMGLYEQLKLE